MALVQWWLHNANRIRLRNWLKPSTACAPPPSATHLASSKQRVNCFDTSTFITPLIFISLMAAVLIGIAVGIGYLLPRGNQLRIRTFWIAVVRGR